MQILHLETEKNTKIHSEKYIIISELGPTLKNLLILTLRILELP